MRFPEFTSLPAKEIRKNRLNTLREELAAKNITPDRKKKVLQEIIDLEREQTESVHGNLVAPEHMHYSGDSEPVESSEVYPKHEKDILDLIEEKHQLEDAIRTYNEALEELKHEDLASLEEFKKIKGLLRGSEGVLELVKKEIGERERMGEAA